MSQFIPSAAICVWFCSLGLRTFGRDTTSKNPPYLALAASGKTTGPGGFVGMQLPVGKGGGTYDSKAGLFIEWQQGQFKFIETGF
ncbi:MAG TPA: hypothetical protein VI685_04085 [Candidatus Angelobacter sp.]